MTLLLLVSMLLCKHCALNGVFYCRKVQVLQHVNIFLREHVEGLLLKLGLPHSDVVFWFVFKVTFLHHSSEKFCIGGMWLVHKCCVPSTLKYVPLF